MNGDELNASPSNTSLTIKVLSHNKTSPLSLGTVIGLCQNNIEYRILYSEDFQKTFEDVLPTFVIRCINVIENTQGKSGNQFHFSFESILIIEPEWLISVTDIVQCVVDDAINTNLLFYDVFKPISISSSIPFGSLVNFIFDEVLLNPETTYDDIFESAMRSKPLVPALLQNEKNSLEELFQKGKDMYSIFKNRIQKFAVEPFTLEPQFVSKQYGIVGRLDYLKTDAELNRLEVIELKSSIAPTFAGSFYFRSIRYPSTMWSSHFIQVVCYQLLVETIFPKSGIVHSIFYASEKENYLRSVPITSTYKRVCLEVRNKIVIAKKQVLSKKFPFHQSLLQNKLGSIPKYSVSEYRDLHKIYSTSSNLELLYFRSMIFFLENESVASAFRFQNSKNKSKDQSLFLFSSEVEKSNSPYFLSNLRLNHWSNDGSISFSIQLLPLTSLRSGDSVLLYPQCFRPELQPLLKASIVSVSKEKIVLKQHHTYSNDYFKPYLDERWCIEIDSTQRSISTNYHKLLSNILYLKVEKKGLLLGLLPPKQSVEFLIDNKIEGVTETQKSAIQNAIACRDYFLIQGPPGTGKTSIVLSEIIKNILETTNETILLVAYTNKVVDELCNVVIRLGYENSMIRLGSSLNEEVKKYTLNKVLSDVSISEFSKILQSKRVVVSTVSSIVSNPDIFLFWKFNTAIVDEAAQIVEAYCIGFLSYCDRFILIGDEKQLPAIVVQNPEESSINSSELQSIGLDSLSESLFSRLLKNAKSKGWNNSFTMLKEQGRMHWDIQQLSNTLYYDQQLTMLHLRQKATITHFESSEFLQYYFSKSRAIFIEVDSIEYPTEQRYGEILTRFIQEIRAVTKLLSIGVISPFRSHNTQILQHFEEQNVNFVDVDTIERYQGSEREIILYSLPIISKDMLDSIESVSLQSGKEIDRKLNVAITRAKEYFVIVGSSKQLRHSKQYADLLDLLPSFQWK